MYLYIRDLHSWDSWYANLSISSRAQRIRVPHLVCTTLPIPAWLVNPLSSCPIGLRAIRCHTPDSLPASFHLRETLEGPRVRHAVLLREDRRVLEAFFLLSLSPVSLLHTTLDLSAIPPSSRRRCLHTRQSYNLFICRSGLLLVSVAGPAGTTSLICKSKPVPEPPPLRTPRRRHTGCVACHFQGTRWRNFNENMGFLSTIHTGSF